MLVYLKELSNPTQSSPQHPTDTIMGPQLPSPSTSTFDIRAHIIDNCEFIVGKDGIVQVITSKDSAGKRFRAYAIRCNGDTREPVLVSEPCEGGHKAVESLYTKSCEAIHNYITTNGFANPPNLKAASLELDMDDDDDTASIISNHSKSSATALSEWGSSGDEATILQHAPGVNGGHEDGQRPIDRQGSHSTEAADAHEPVRRSRSRTAVRDYPEYTGPSPPRARPARPARSRSPPAAIRQAQLAPSPRQTVNAGSDRLSNMPPSMRGMPIPPPPRSPPSAIAAGPRRRHPQDRMGPPLRPAQSLTCFRVSAPPVDGRLPSIGQGSNWPPKLVSFNNNTNDGNNGNRNGNSDSSNPPRPISVFHPTTQMHTVLITVVWVHHGQHRLITQCHPTRDSLQSAAVRDVRMNPGAFTTGNSPGSKGAPGTNRGYNGGNDRPVIRAYLRQAVFSGETYDMRAFHGQDLTPLFLAMATDDGIPFFEIVVEDVPDVIEDDDDEDDNSTRDPTDTAKNERWD
jgi:hypothetical protein